MSRALVLLHGVRVGVLEGSPVEEGFGDDHHFAFDPDWVADPEAPVLGQQFEDRKPRGFTSSGLPAWFAHLLPPPPLRRYIARWAGLGGEPDDLELLIASGDDLPGAVVAAPARLVQEGGGRGRRPATAPGAIGFALPGMQWKLSLREGEGRLVLPLAGEVGDFIGKFPHPQYPRLTEVEHATTCWARCAEVKAHHTQLRPRAELESLPPGLPDSPEPLLLATRFDRAPGGGRVHVEDLAQVAGLAPASIYKGSFEQLSALVATLCPQDLPELLRRIVFMVVSGNGDAHWKNWGLIYPDRRTPRLGPAYDLVSTAVYGRQDDLALDLGGTRAFAELHPARWSRLAQVLRVDHARLVSEARAIRELAETLLAERGEDLGYSPRELQALGLHLRRLPRW